MAKKTWNDLILHPMAIAISGARGSGKSCLAYWLADTMSRARCCNVVVLGLTPEKEALLPAGWAIIDSITQAPPGCVVLVDEVALQFHARRSASSENLEMDRVLSISRQAAQDVIFATHNFRKMDVALVSDLDVIALKKPSFLHSRFERSEIRQFTQAAAAWFEQHSKNHKAWTYVFSDNFEGVVQNPLPAFWTEDLSCGWATTNPYQRALCAAGVRLSIEELRIFETDPYFEIHREFVNREGKLSKHQATCIKADLDEKRGLK